MELVFYESRVRYINTHFHIAEVVYLLLSFSHTLFMDSVADVRELSVHIVAREQNKLPSLVVIIVFETPHAQFIFF